MNIKWSKVNFIAAIVGARVSMGLFSNITSPTLPTLAQNCNVSIATVSWIFTVRSVASFIGAAGVHAGRFHFEFRNFKRQQLVWNKTSFQNHKPNTYFIAITCPCGSLSILHPFRSVFMLSSLLYNNNFWKSIWVTDFWLLCLLILLPGVAQGIVTGGLQSVILSLWGADKSRTLMQAYG